MKKTMTCWAFLLALVGVNALLNFSPNTAATPADKSRGNAFKFGGLRSFEIVSLEAISEPSANASIGDLNGDGHPDIVLAKGRHWPASDQILFGDGKGHFTQGPTLPKTKSYSALLADMTKSGHLDIVQSTDSPEPKQVLINDGKGNFSVGGTYGEPTWSSRNAAIGDFNRDGYPDIVVANRNMASYVCMNDGKLHFDCRPLPDSPSASQVVVADMNGDGADDVIYACRDECQSAVYFNDGKGNFTRKVPWGPAKASIRAITAADFNGDGHLDIAACQENGDCSIYFGDGQGHFGEGVQFDKPVNRPYSMIVADLNRDGRPDILVGYRPAFDPSMKCAVGRDPNCAPTAPGVIFFNKGDGIHYEKMTFGDGKGEIYGMAAGDLDGDGWLDVVVARSGAPCFLMFNRPPKNDH